MRPEAVGGDENPLSAKWPVREGPEIGIFFLDSGGPASAIDML